MLNGSIKDLRGGRKGGKEGGGGKEVGEGEGEREREGEGNIARAQAPLSQSLWRYLLCLSHLSSQYSQELPKSHALTFLLGSHRMVQMP